MNSISFPVQRGIAAARGFAIALMLPMLLHSHTTAAQNTHTLPLVLPASDARPDGLVRIVNRSERAGTVTIHAIDDTGQRFGPVSLSIGAKNAVNFNSAHLESGLSGGVGDGQGYWRLELDTALDIEALAYVRSADGSLAGVHDVVANQSMRHHVLIFNPASNVVKRSELRLLNTSGIDTDVVITGLDDRGATAPGGDVRLTLPAGEARTLSAQALESGGEGFEGSFGDGAGKWQVFVSAGRPIQVMSLLASAGNLSNISSGGARDDTIRGGPGGDELFGGNGDDVFDPGDNRQSDDLAADRGYDTVHGSRGNDTIIYTGSGAEAYQDLRYSDPDAGDYLDTGITATIDGAANRGTIDKGSAGTDTLVNVANPLNADGFELYGTGFDDVFNLTMDDDQFQFMDVLGEAGNDTFNIRLNGGWVRVDYHRAPGGINVDLRTGRALDDGHGTVDTFTGDIPRGIAGSRFSDVIRGSDRYETFFGREGNDTIDGGGGNDRLRFGYRSRFAASVDVQDLRVDLDAGTATGTWNGSPFSYSISNIEQIEGGTGNDVIRGALAEVRGSSGDDRIVFTDGDTYGEVSYSRLLGNGIQVTIDGTANRATVNKGSAGVDTIEGIADLVRGDGPGFGLNGTSSNDVFNITADGGNSDNWMQVEGGAGDDTFNIGSFLVRLQYHGSPGGIHVDLGAGTVRNDGYGDTDTIRGRVREIRGSDFSDTIIGSGNDESFIGRAGNDTIDGGGGWDRLRFDRSCCAISNLVVDLDEGFAAGTWNGNAFNYKVSNIEWVRGGNSGDVFRDKVGDNRFEGRGGRDGYVFIPGHGHNTITDFNEQEWILLDGFNLTNKSDVLEAATSGPDGTTINLSAWGGGTIFLRNFFNLTASNIRL